MKNKTKCVIALSIAMLSGFCMNAQIDNLTNVSAEWIRSGTRNASLEGTDLMVYNPAGMSRLKSGFHLNAGNQFFMRSPKHEYSVDVGFGTANYSYKQEGNDPFVPDLFLSYNKEKWAICGGMYIASGGGKANYPKGSITTDLISLSVLGGLSAGGFDYTNTKNNYLEASAYTIASVLGGAYSVNDMISLGLLVRHLSGKNTTKLGMTAEDMTGTLPDVPLTLETEDKASGVGVIAGVNLKVNEKLNFAMRYESQVALAYKTKIKSDEFGFADDGSKSQRDFPAVLGLGASFSAGERTRINFDYNFYFQKQADWDKTELPTGEANTSELAGNASTYALSAEYRINDRFLWSIGGTYSKFSYENQAGYFMNPGAYEIAPGDNIALSTGFAFNPIERVRINVGFTQALYSKQNIEALNYFPLNPVVTTTSSTSIIGIGVDLLF